MRKKTVPVAKCSTRLRGFPLALQFALLYIHPGFFTDSIFDYGGRQMTPVPQKILRLVLRGRIEFSKKSFEELFAGPHDEDDLKNAILLGQVIKKKRDETRVAKYKFTIIGPALDGVPLYCCGKIRKKTTGEEFFIITFHRAKS